MKEVEQSTLDRLQQILSADFDSAKHNVIFPTDQGYDLFGSYVMVKHTDSVEVTKHNNDARHFSSTRSAVSWCVADKFNRFNLAEEIISLDEKRKRLIDDVKFSRQLVKTIRDPLQHETVILKLEFKKEVLKQVEHGLDKCASSAKYWQLRGFNNEIERTRRSTSNKDNRTSIRIASR